MGMWETLVFSFIVYGGMKAEGSGKAVIEKCLKEPPDCSKYECLARKSDIRHLSSVRCSSDADCYSEDTGLYCREFNTGGYCDCPKGYAYDPTKCECRQAEPCGREVYCHNGMKCSDQWCSCKGDLGNQTLFEPHGRLCVLSRISPEYVFQNYFSGGDKSSHSGISLILIIAGTLGILILLVAFTARWCIKREITCKKGDYECEEEEEDPDSSLRRNDVHVAAWDLPSLDYLTEEEAALKYIKKERRSPEDGSSLPECEQSHDNAGYISDNQ